MTNRSTVIAFTWAVLLAMRTLSAHGAPLAGAASPVAPAAEASLAPLGPGDTVKVEVYGQPDMSSTVYIGDDGAVSVPLVGAVQVKGLSPVKAATRIEEALKTGQYLVDPHVTISVVLSRSQRVMVQGEVAKTGPFPLEPGNSVFDIIASAGGLTQEAGDAAFVIHHDDQGVETRIQFNPRPSAASLSSTVIPKLQSTDTIYVPRADRFYIYGEVTAPNMYRIEPGMTVIQAIARAGGITPRGSERRVLIKRTDASGHEVIVHAKGTDLVKADDVIRVKESIF